MVSRHSVAAFVVVLGLWTRAVGFWPFEEETLGETNRDESVLEPLSEGLDMLSASDPELRALPLWSAGQAEQWIRLRSVHKDFAWTWKSVADSLDLSETQFRQMQSVYVLGGGPKDRGLIRLTMEGGDGDALSGWKGTLRGRYAVGRESRSEVVAVRRADDPRILDDFHITLSGRAKQAALTYVVGTYQLDWGLGLLASTGFGTARAFSSMESYRSGIGHGIVARIPSSEYSWFRGGVFEYGERINFLAGVNAREWNATVGEGGTRLTGTFDASNEELAARDRVREQGGFAGIRYRHGGLAAGMLYEQEGYDQVIPGGKDAARQGSFYAGYSAKELTIHAEGARSGSDNAWCAQISRGTERFVWALYSLYGSEGFAPLRGQGWRTYGEPASDVVRRGLRAGWFGDVQHVHVEFRDDSDGSDARGEAEIRYAHAWASESDIELRASTGNRDTEGESDRSFERFRVECNWQDAVLWTARMELRQSRARGGQDISHGSYMFAQAEKKWRRISVGGRVTRFQLPAAESPVMIYEHDVSGAYPLQRLSGKGSRTAAWIGLSGRSFRIALKAALTRQDEALSTSEFGVEATFVH